MQACEAFRCRGVTFNGAHHGAVTVPTAAWQRSEPAELFELRITRKDPAAMTPRPDGVLGEPSPQRRFADGSDQTALDHGALDIGDLETRDR